MLLRLADERATGVLLRDHGALFLADGQVVHAEAPAAPGLDVLLTASGRLRPDRWEEAVTAAGARHEVARHLVDSGQVSGGEMELCHLAALFDAAYFALAPAGGPTRFRYGVAHWLGRVRPVPTRTVEREVLRRGRLLDSLWPHASVDTAPVVRLSPLPRRALGPGRRALLELADGVRTPAAIARELGHPAFNTLAEVRRLAAEGIVATPAPDPLPLSAPDPLPLPPPGGTARPVPHPPPTRHIPHIPYTPDTADTALLRRIRDALEAVL
ncbi:transcriptional regulator [Streptomyces sp. NPDC055078]